VQEGSPTFGVDEDFGGVRAPCGRFKNDLLRSFG
jgi:hypothetical protein